MTKLSARSLAFARQALDWWLGELIGMVPTRIRQKLTFARSHIVLAPDDAGYAVLYCSGATTRPLGRIPADAPMSPVSLTAAIGDAGLVRRTLRAKLPLILRLPASKALVTRLSLPAAVKADLPQILRFEMDRRTPFSAESAFFSYDILPDGAAGKITVVMTVIAKVAVTELLTRLAPLGVPIRQVTVAGSADKPVSGNLLPAEKTGNGKLRLALRLGTLGVVLTVAAGLYSMWQDSEAAVAALRQEMARLRKTVEQVEATRVEIDRLQTASAFLSDRRRNSLTATHMLADLTRMLPDDTWLLQLSMTDDKLQVAGYSAAAAGLIEKVMHSPAFRTPQFRSAVTQDAAIGRERFELVMTISAGNHP
jgi:general secretion pathway protein L